MLPMKLSRTAPFKIFEIMKQLYALRVFGCVMSSKVSLTLMGRFFKVGVLLGSHENLIKHWAPLMKGTEKLHSLKV